MPSFPLRFFENLSLDVRGLQTTFTRYSSDALQNTTSDLLTLARVSWGHREIRAPSSSLVALANRSGLLI